MSACRQAQEEIADRNGLVNYSEWRERKVNEISHYIYLQGGFPPRLFVFIFDLSYEERRTCEAAQGLCAERVPCHASNKSPSVWVSKWVQKAITQSEREKSDVTRDSGIELNVAIRLSFFIIVTSFTPFTCDVFCEVHGRHHTHREGHVDRQELAFGLSAGFHLRCSRAAEQLHSADSRQTAQGQ